MAKHDGDDESPHEPVTELRSTYVKLSYQNLAILIVFIVVQTVGAAGLYFTQQNWHNESVANDLALRRDRDATDKRVSEVIEAQAREHDLITAVRKDHEALESSVREFILAQKQDHDLLIRVAAKIAQPEE